MGTQHFSQSYREARRRFLDAARAHPRFDREWSRSFGDAGGAPLATDAVLIRGREPTRDLFVATSGLHGVEGFAGSAIQLAILEDATARDFAHDILLIHAVNPFGFHYKRRVNRDHLDLNRNGLTGGEPEFNAGYERVRRLFNPGRSLVGRPLAQRWIMARLLARAAVDKETVKRAFLAGQYSDPSGPFYGGTAVSAELENAAAILEEVCGDYDIMGHLDLHTGYGVRGRGHLLCHSEDTRRVWVALGFEPEPLQGGANYKMSGQMISYLRRRLNKARSSLLYLPVLLEFGTLGLDLKSQLESMRIMIVDNSAGTLANPTDEFLELFNPTCPRWRHDVSKQGLRYHRQLMEALGHGRVPVPEAMPERS